jgi:hypothetical protein
LSGHCRCPTAWRLRMIAAASQAVLWER